MGTGLYDAVFAALGRMYGRPGRAPITNLTLFGGFAGTVCWPLSALLIDHLGWRGACLVYAGLHLIVSLPLQMAVVRRASARTSATDTAADTLSTAKPMRMARETLIFVLLALALSIAAGIGSTVIVHMMIFLQARGVAFSVAGPLPTLVFTRPDRSPHGCRAIAHR